MLSVFRYPGGKTKLTVRNKILAAAPASFSEYREPFVGGGGIFFSIDASKKRWINDANPDLIEVYRALQERPNSFIKDCRKISPPRKGEPEVYPKASSKGKKYNKRLKEKFDFFAENEKCDQALRYYFVNRTVWMGRVNYEELSRMYFSNPSGWNIVKSNKLEDAAECLIGTKITTGDFEPLLYESGDDVWIYCDPPYVKDTELARNSKLYKYGFTMEDHSRLASALSCCPHRFCLSYDNHPLVLELYKSFNIVEHEWAYSGSSKSKKDIGRELLITNY